MKHTIAVIVHLIFFSGAPLFTDAQDFSILRVGTQEWMGKNLNTDKFSNGESIPEAKTRQEWTEAGLSGKAAWCYFNNDPSSNEKHGKLYNWHVVSDPRGICPQGWRVPTDEDWNKLTESLGGLEEAGLKLISNRRWNNGVLPQDLSKIPGLSGGYRCDIGNFYDNNESGYWWTLSELSKADSWDRSLDIKKTSMKRTSGNKGNGESIRCIRNTQ